MTSTILQNSSLIQLMETGNFVLFQDQSKSVIAWQSFDYPTNTILPNMKAGWHRRTGLNTVVTSWKSRDDLGTGEYEYKLKLNGTPKCIYFFFFCTKVQTGFGIGMDFAGVVCK